MGSPFIVQQHINRFSVGTTATQTFVAMPNQPLSAVFLTYESILTSANAVESYVTFLNNLTKVLLTWKGSAIWSVNGTDLARVVKSLGTFQSPLQRTAFTANARRIMTLCIPFGRNLFDPNECLPATDKGTLQLEIDTAADGAVYKTQKLTVETLQLPGATPKQFIRCQTISDTPAATGNKDYDLPRLFPLAGIGVSTTNSEPASTTDDIETFTILQNFIQFNYASIGTNAARALQWNKIGPSFADLEHVHLENTAGAYAQNATSGTEVLSGSLTTEWHYLDFDWDGSGTWFLDASKATDLKLRVNYNAANAARVLPVEVWPVSTLLPGT